MLKHDVIELVLLMKADHTYDVCILHSVPRLNAHELRGRADRIELLSVHVILELTARCNIILCYRLAHNVILAHQLHSIILASVAYNISITSVGDS